MGGTIWISSGGLTIPAISSGLFDAKQTLLVVNYAGSAATVTNSSGQSINSGGGCSTTIPAGGFWQLQPNGTSIDCVQAVSTNGSTTVANGTSAMGTSSISSAACATAVTTTATGTATTDTISWGFNGDPTAVTGYVPLVAGMLTIIAYPSSNNVNFKVCNNTNSSVTPGAITLNWRVIR
jgi:hypothetical protein